MSKHHDWESKLRELGQKMGKFKFPLLIFALGLLLLAIPTRSKPAQEPEPKPVEESQSQAETLRATEEKLEQILSQISGAGRVEVMLQYAAGPKTLYQTDVGQEVSTDSQGKQTKTESTTVLASGGSSIDTPVVTQTVYPTYQGALIVAQGADSAQLRLHLVNAVSGLTGLGADKITVVKMKSD